MEHAHHLELYLLHPIAVHFPIALLVVGLGGAVLHAARDRPAWLPDAVSWLLWLGTLGAWAAFGLGLLAEKTAPHVPPAWETLSDHEFFARWTVGLFTALSLWRFREDRRGRRPRPVACAVFLTLWIAAAGVLAKTAHLGGHLVFTHGMGVGVEDEH